MTGKQMNTKRSVSTLVLAAMVLTTIPAAASERTIEPTVRDIVQTRSEIGAVVDPITGERFEVQVPGPGSRMPRVHTSLKAWLIAGVVVGVVVGALAILFHGEH